MKHALLMKKLGMTQIVSDGCFVPVTLLKYLDNKVLCVKKYDQKSAALVGFGSVEERYGYRFTRPVLGVFKKYAQGLFSKMVEVPVDGEESSYSAGSSIDISVFSEGSVVDVIGTSKGKGFAGAMKRHGFRGCEATHGVSLSHRVHGSTGNRTWPGRVFKNKKMAGHMGNARVTTQNLSICKIDQESGIIAVKGAVPGGIGSYVLVRDAIKL